MKRKLVLILIVLIAFTGLLFAQGKTDKDAGVVNINYWAGLTGSDRQVMEELVDAFNAENQDVKVEFFSAPWSEMFTKWAAAFGTASGPDVVMVHNTDIPNFASRKMLASLDELGSALGIREADYPGSVWKGNSYLGVQYGIPLDFHPMGVFKNVDAFRAAGIDPDITFDSMEKFIETAQKLTVSDARGNVTQWGVGLGSDHAHSMRYWYGLLFQAGGQFLTADDAKAAFNSAAGKQALQFLADWVTKYEISPYHQSDIDRDWMSGNVAMVIEGPWFISTASDSDINFTVAPFPQIFKQPGVWSGSHSLAIPSSKISDARSSAATRLVTYIAQNSLKWADSGQIPASYAVTNSSAYKALDNYVHFKAFLDQGEFVKYEPLIPKTAELGADNQLSPVLNSIYSVIRGDSTVDRALTEAERQTNEILK